MEVRSIKKRILIYLLIGLFIYLPFNLPSQIATVAPSVVYIEAGYEYGYGEWSGSGVIINKKGLILTAKHVLEGADWVRVTLTNGDTYDATNWIVDPNDDVGVLQIATLKDLPEASFEVCGLPDYIGQKVFIIGYPFGIYSVNQGMISNVRLDEPFFGVEPMLQLDIAGNPGNSGCPVFDMNGDVIGILVGGIRGGDGIAFITSADVCKELIENYVESYPENI